MHSYRQTYFSFYYSAPNTTTIITCPVIVHNTTTALETKWFCASALETKWFCASALERSPDFHLPWRADCSRFASCVLIDPCVCGGGGGGGHHRLQDQRVCAASNVRGQNCTTQLATGQHYKLRHTIYPINPCTLRDTGREGYDSPGV